MHSLLESAGVLRCVTLGTKLPELKPLEAVSAALHFAELVAAQRPPTVASGSAHTLYIVPAGATPTSPPRAHTP